jgi:hypothetical protein
MTAARIAFLISLILLLCDGFGFTLFVRQDTFAFAFFVLGLLLDGWVFPWPKA